MGLEFLGSEALTLNGGYHSSYYILLSRYRPFIVHCIRLPLLSTLLFAAANVNTNTQCDSLVIDQRLYLTTRGSIEKLLGNGICCSLLLD